MNTFRNAWGRTARMIAWGIAGCLSLSVASGRPGDDVVEAFARAAKGEPLRYVAIGGSITQASGPGWIGDWLREQFPRSEVSIVNSGMSATGSSLGIFRLDRDVIAHQPDLVAIEYCVNDGGLDDEETIRCMETLVVRLKSLPNPPAIMILEAAARQGVNLRRHRLIARHYDLLEVDWQAAVAERMKTPGAAWGELFSDDVHPNAAGHSYYATVMEKALLPLVGEAKSGRGGGAPVRPGLPAPLSSKPLLLDARMAPLHGIYSADASWKREPSPSSWYGRFFQGVISSGTPGAVLRLPFRGTTAGLFYELDKSHGSFYANVDGSMPLHCLSNSRGGYTSTLIATDLPAREHILTVVLPPESREPANALVTGPVKLGYLLVAGETGASRETSPAGPYDEATLKALRFVALPAPQWSWAGPFHIGTGVDGRKPIDARAAITTHFLPEPGDLVVADAKPEWKPVMTGGNRVDFRSLTGSSEPAVSYARTQWTSEHGGKAILAVELDYFGYLWLNDERILALDGPHHVPVFIPVNLRGGVNTLVMKVGAGSAGFNFKLSLAETPRP